MANADGERRRPSQGAPTQPAASSAGEAEATAAGATESGPGTAFQDFETMSALLDSLKMLHYDDQYCQRMKFKPFSPHYFAIKTNPGEQFWSFASIATWLARECGKQIQQPQIEFDDPNAVITNILDVIRQFGQPVNFPPARLKEGYGPQCLYVLTILAEQALKTKSIAYRKPQYTAEDDDHKNVQIVDDAETELIWKSRENGPVGMDDSDDVPYEAPEDHGHHLLDLNAPASDSTSTSPTKGMKEGRDDPFRLAAALESTADASEWKLEVERVAPELKVTFRSDPRDWRIHLEQFSQHNGQLGDSVKTLKGELDKLTGEIDKTLEKIASREKYLSSQLDSQLVQFREAQNGLGRERDRYAHASTGIVERQAILNEVNDELETVKREMRERGNAMTDAQPLRNIRDAISNLRKEIGQLEIRIGVVEHCLIQAKLASKSDVIGSNDSGLLADQQDPILGAHHQTPADRLVGVIKQIVI